MLWVRGFLAVFGRLGRGVVVSRVDRVKVGTEFELCGE